MNEAELIRRNVEKRPDDPGMYRDAVAVVYDGVKRGETGFHGLNMDLRRLISAAIRRNGEKDRVVSELNDTYYKSLLIDAPVNFDAYCQYIEKNRDVRKRFYIPRRKQLLPVVKSLQRLLDDEIDLLGISLPPGVGKALANDTPILTRNGWKNHGDLVIGDEVIGLDGKFKRVIAVHPKCMLDCLVEFSNGEKIQCHENHEWLIHDRGRRANQERDYIAETKRLEKRTLNSGAEPGHRGHRYTVQLPHRKYVQGEEKELPLDPYLFGVWLGDGANKNPRICCAEKDKSVIDRIVNNGTPVRWQTIHKNTGVLYYDFDIRFKLQSMGMCHSRKIREKHISEEYLTASTRQRLELLAGLIDTDGTLVGSKYQFTTAEPMLRDTFIDLLSTFGWRASVQVKKPTVSSSGIAARKEHYVIGFTPDIQIPCELERKRNKEPHNQIAIGFKSITRVKPKEGNCITVEGDGMYLAGRRMLPTHNTTLAIFLLTWVAGRWPEEPNLTGSHSNAFVRGVYDECLRIFDKDGEYLWHDVFPEVKVSGTNAKDYRIDIGKRKRFETLEFTSIGSGNAGLYRAGRLLYCDDLISGLEIALSKERLDKLWETYTTDLRQRKIGDHCKELHIATRWSVNDVIGRLERQYEGSDRAEFIAVPALNERDESNFEYMFGVGFSTEFYREQREVMDDASWRALYMNQPIEREGLLYHPDELRRYFELPDREPDAILCVCDTKDRGADYCSMPIAYQYGQDYYIEDVVFNNGNPEIVEAEIVTKLLEHKVHMGRFESNSAGGRVAQSVQEEVKKRGGRTKLTTKFTTQNKETKIVMASPYVKEHFVFRDQSVIRDKEYRAFLNNVCSWTMNGKAKHDDGPDSLAMLADYVQTFAQGQVTVFARPF